MTNTKDPQLDARLKLALGASREAGDLTLRYFRGHNYQVETKADASPVTVADREAEKLLRERIAATFPDDAILGEELGERPGTSGYRWILDPIDGTKSFISGVPLYATLVGVEHGGRSVVGVIRIPALGECVYAATGGGAWYTAGEAAPEPARVSKVETLGKGLFCTSDVKTFTEIGQRKVYDQLEAKARLSRTWGDGYGYLLVATGRAELQVDPKMNLWDCAALQPVMEEAGGTFTDWQGQPTIHATASLATNGRILDEVLAITRDAR